MQITLETKPYATLEADALVAFVFEENDPIQSHLLDIDSSSNGLLKKLQKSGELTGKMLEFTLIHAPVGLDDIADLLVRPNLTPNFSPHAYRVKAARWATLWPELTVVQPDVDNALTGQEASP